MTLVEKPLIGDLRPKLAEADRAFLASRALRESILNRLLHRMRVETLRAEHLRDDLPETKSALGLPALGAQVHLVLGELAGAGAEDVQEGRTGRGEGEHIN